MAVQAEASAHIDPQLVGNSFVEQYYKVLHQFPDQLHRFYQDSSFLSRPGTNGDMISVTTTRGISEQIVSLDYQNYQTEILTVDAQGSYCSGVIALVTGYLIVKDNEKRKFAQSFFLAPQENGFYVLNDIFRYVDDKQPLGMPINDVVETAPLSPLAPRSEPTHVPNHLSLAEDTNNHKEAGDTLQNGKALVPDNQNGNANAVNHSVGLNQNAVPPVSTGTDSPDSPSTFQNNNIQTVTGTDSPKTFQDNIQNASGTDSPRKFQNGVQTVSGADSPRKFQNGVQTVPGTDSSRAIQNNVQTVTGNESPRTFQNGIQAVTETDSPRTPSQDEGSKKSYASIVNRLKENSAPFQVRVPPPSSKLPRVAGASQASAPSSTNALKENAAKSNSIFVANLPLDVTVEQVKQIFLKFGPIKANGIRVRTNQLRPNCFSFVEFESVNSVENALKASPITFGDRKVFIEEKKGPGNDSTTPVRRSMVGYQTDNLRVRMNANGRKPQGSSTVGRVGVDSPKAQQNNEAGRVQSKVAQKEGAKTTNPQQNKATRIAKQ